ncbi:hypothetical protein LS633_02645 [Pseudomonas sp. NIBR-H-19]|uniref:hypothetical protein n=1 Tax=Pseudomonas sp. NIBR-H-19 TaxID=2901380 RepID=UPI001E5944DB|nr:hypothetical protein [Pseudomonas sp. NIBR-H-19]UHC82752.1 hypothetical protein LS633_02645 [Pseudomonas sp. NIBR-H-19]
MAKAPASPKKTETLTLRLDPKMKYAIEVLARSQKRTLAGAIEWAVERSLESQHVRSSFGEKSLMDVVDHSWNPDDLLRIVALGSYAEQLLNHEESCVWSVIKATPLLHMETLSSTGEVNCWHQWAEGIKAAEALIQERAKQLSVTGRFDPIPMRDLLAAAGKDSDQINEFLARIREIVFDADQN